MGDRLGLIRGAGGGSGGSSEASDTVRATQTADVLDLVSEGECEGLVDGLRSVYYDGVPLVAADGSYNFKNSRVQTLLGTQGQAGIDGLTDVQNEIGVGVDVPFATPIVRTITNPAIDTCRVTIVVPQLSHTDASTGNLTGSSFEWAIEVQSNGGGYVEVMRERIAEKTMSRYPVAKRFALPGAAPWQIRVRRLTADSGSANTVNAFAWGTYAEIQTLKLRYPNSAMVRSLIGAEQFSRIPVRSFDWLGLRILVPSNYDPKTRVYTGVWDGTFKIAWTDNPAWIYHDMVRHNRYGLGRYVTVGDGFKWELYAIARYCDEMVPDGYGGMEPRFRCSPVLTTREQAYKVLTDLAAILRGMTYWLNTSITLVQEAPSDPVIVYGASNVVDRKFNYATAGGTKRYSQVVVWYNDLAQQGKLTPEVYVDPELVAELGVKALELSPMGIWSRGQALRLAKWAIYTQENETEAVTFSVGLDGAVVPPGKVFQIADPNEAGERLSGRVHSATTMNVQLDADVTLAVGESYLLTATLPDPAKASGLKLQKRAVVTPAGVTRSLTVALPFDTAPAVESVWMLESDQIEPTTWRCIGLAEGAKNTYTISALQHAPQKYALIEFGTEFERPLVSRIRLVPPAPTALRFTETPYLSGSLLRSRLTVSWETSEPGLVYLFSWRLNDGPWIVLPTTGQNSVELDAPVIGVVDVEVQSRNALGKNSAVLEGGTTLVVDSEVFAEWANLVGRPANIAGLTGTEAIRNADLVIGAVNLLAQSTNFATFGSPTIGGGMVILATGQPDPLGGTSASRISFSGAPVSGSFRSVIGLRPGGTYTASVWVKRQEGTNFCLTATDGATWVGSVGAVSTAALGIWARLVITLTTQTDRIDICLGGGHANPGLPAQSAATVLLAFAQLEEGNTATQWSLAPEDIAAIIATAQQTADTANAQLAAIADNNVLDRTEKPAVLLDWTALDNEQSGIGAQATEYGITTEKAAYYDAKNTLALYLQSLGPGGINGWKDTSVDTPIVRATFVSVWAAVYSLRQALLNKIAKVAGTIAEWSKVIGAGAVNQSIATAQLSANNAAGAAALAQQSANSAQAELSAIASDSLLTPGEKPTVVRDYSVLITEQEGIDAQAVNYGVTAEKANYDAAIATLIAYLGTLNSPTHWDDLNGSTTIVGSTFRARFIAAYTARQGVLDRVSANAKARLGALATQNTVGTPLIALNAINNPASTYVPTTVAINGAATILGSIGIVCSGEPVNLIAGATLQAVVQPSGSGTCTMELWRDGTLLSSGGGATFSLPQSGFSTTTFSQSASTPPYRDNPGAGTFTYYLKATPINFSAGVSWSGKNAGVIAIEVKR